ncbi:zinc-dependent peptidase [Tamlana sp. 2_MG-2023]|uniref:zinc-dependent peptidase n=1 Tax=unclassified Tamlana TaxID=2614803 RepID=UPI0026E2F970|nr:MULTISPECIES: zinc-dependent peptidase [unclassified Tamlana]MDO6758578.1 zinc-dependent peptidase [Tamlana sp. 2_MG-2023]MDO6789277.1 zinc-dependent peptidase [Tamlana sp. 1_MG-2023]
MSFPIIIQDENLTGQIILGVLFAILFYMILHFLVRTLEMGYVLRYMKPWYTHFYVFRKTLNKNQKQVLKTSFPFYNKLDKKRQGYFEHRVACFIDDKNFIGRNGFVITDQVEVLISATAVMLTFGFRDFYIGIISKIIIYPEAYYSNINKAFHKGEFNPRLNTLVLCWKDFKKGIDIEDDNLNLGIHEFAHAIHINSIKERDISSTIFSDSFKELTELLQNEPVLRANLIESHYFRKYAFTNQFEFLAVILETFIETPSEFKSKFPEVYSKTKQMLNFNFAGY